MANRTIPDSWVGWTFWESYLIDPAGNRYSTDQIQTSLYTMELAHELRGSPLQILSLKRELLRKLEANPPRIVVDWDGVQTVILPPKRSSFG